MDSNQDLHVEPDYSSENNAPGTSHESTENSATNLNVNIVKTCPPSPGMPDKTDKVCCEENRCVDDIIDKNTQNRLRQEYMNQLGIGIDKGHEYLRKYISCSEIRNSYFFWPLNFWRKRQTSTYRYTYKIPNGPYLVETDICLNGFLTIFNIDESTLQRVLHEVDEQNLFKACSSGDLTTVSEYIHRGAQVSCIISKHLSRNDQTPLHKACEKGHIKICQALLQAGADVNLLLRYDCIGLFSGGVTCLDSAHHFPVALTPLQTASYFGHDKICQLLLQAGADVHAKDSNQATTLHFPQTGKVCDLLLKAGADVHARNVDQFTPLHFARTPEVCDLLLKAGADVDARTVDADTPLLLASSNEGCPPIDRKEQDKICKVLLQAGADVNAQNELWYTQNTSLHWAAQYNKPGLCKMLLEAGADVHARNAKQNTPLLKASEQSWSEWCDVCDVLLKAGSDVNASNNEQITPLLNAFTNHNSSKACLMLLKAGADANARNRAEDTPFCLVARSSGFNHGGRESMHLVVAALLKAGADVHARNKKQETPLFVAANCSNVVVCDLLVKAGADVSARNENQDTPLHKAADKYYSSEVLYVLLKAGADVNAKNGNQETPLHLAVHNQLHNDCEALLKAGADVNASNNDQETALHKAAKTPRRETPELYDVLLKADDVNLNARNKDQDTPLHIAAMCAKPVLADMLLKAGVDVHAKNKNNEKPIDVIGKLDKFTRDPDVEIVKQVLKTAMMKCDS